MTNLATMRAKSDGETLLEHTAQVLDRLADQVRLRPDLPAQMGYARLWHTLAWAGLLHDLGKLASGFQQMLAGGGAWGYRHEVGSLAFLGWLFPDPRSDDYRWVAAAVVAHHKDAADLLPHYPDDGPALREIAAQLAVAPLEEVWDWLHDTSPAWLRERGFEGVGVECPPLLPRAQAVALVREQGAQQMAQALRQYRRLSRDLEQMPSTRQRFALLSLVVRGLLITADRHASAHTGALPHLPAGGAAGVQQRLEQLRSAPISHYTHQQASAAIEQNLLLTAPTGSGKTEAALYWAFGVQVPPRHVPRLVYMLPFQASLNAMRERLEQFFPGLVGLQHGRAIQAIYRVYVEQHGDPHIALQQARTHADQMALNVYPLRVCSPYQVLKAVYRLRGYEMLISDLIGASIIIDEIHAYEPQRLALILSLVSYLRQRCAARFCVMSATFPSLIAERLHAALGEVATVQAESSLFARFQRHRLRLRSGDLLDPAVWSEIATQARAGQTVLVCCNTVDRVQTVWRGLREHLGPDAETILLHSRLNGRDRLARERQVQQRCGLHRQNRQPVVLVATQVVEVSLNIDLDTIYTDLAPLEALIQRCGRVNRTGRRDDHEQPMLAEVHIFRGPIPEKNLRPYDLRLLRGTLRLLEEHDGQPLDEAAVGSWLDTVYAEYTDDYAEEWQQIYATHAAQCAALLNGLVAFQADDELERQFYQAFDSMEVLPQRFVPEYLTLLNERQYVAAHELLVPIPYWRYGMLKRAGRVRPGTQSDDPLERVTVVQIAYDDDRGLLFAPDDAEEDSI